MPRDVDQLTSALETATPGEASDVYSLLAAWDRSLDTALDRGGGDRFRRITKRYLEDAVDLVDAAATADGLEWAFLEDCVDAYPAGVGDHHCSAILTNVVARCVIRASITEDVEAIPAWALEYHLEVTMRDDSEWAWRSSGAAGWGVDHPAVAVPDRTVARAADDDESWAMGVLEHAMFAEPDAGIGLLERLLSSPDVQEDLMYVRAVEPTFIQTFPAGPDYWEPETELDHHVEIPDDSHERLLAVIGERIHPDRLRHWDDDVRLDLARAADAYGPADDE